MAALTTSWAAASRLTSPCNARASPPPARISSTTPCAAGSLVLKFTTTAAPRVASLMAQARPMPREAPVTSATRPVSRLMNGPARSLPARAEEAEEVAPLAEPPPHHLAVPQHLRGERDHLARPEVEAAVELVERSEDLGPREMRIAQGALLDARPVHEAAVVLEPAVPLRLLVERGPRVRRGEGDLDRVGI